MVVIACHLRIPIRLVASRANALSPTQVHVQSRLVGSRQGRALMGTTEDGK